LTKTVAREKVLETFEPLYIKYTKLLYKLHKKKTFEPDVTDMLQNEARAENE